MISGDEIKKNISKNIVKYREKVGLSQKELAQKLNTTSSRISNWEQGSNCPTIDILFEVCRVLNVSINDIYGVYPDSEMTLSYDEQECIKKYRFISEHSPEGIETINYILDREYKIADQLRKTTEYNAEPAAHIYPYL
jgi:Predicted transcriptional regulators